MQNVSWRKLGRRTGVIMLRIENANGVEGVSPCTGVGSVGWGGMASRGEPWPGGGMQGPPVVSL
jgi:hypothetical protein